MALSSRSAGSLLAAVVLAGSYSFGLLAQQPGTPPKIRHVDPVHPEEARQARIQGVVIVQITVGTDGRVSNSRVIRSIPLLDQAALTAVKQWVYDASAIKAPVTLTVTVPFGVAVPQATIATPPARPAPAGPPASAQSTPASPSAESQSAGRAASSAGDQQRVERLIDAAREGDTATVMALLKAGVDVNAVSNGDGRTALMAATESARVATVKALLDARASVNAETGGPTALMLAAANPSDNGVTILKLLLAQGAAVDAKDGERFSKGDTALHHAARSLNHGAVFELLNADADPDARGYLDSTPLVEAAFAGRIEPRIGPKILTHATEVVETLIDAGADVNLAGRLKLTPLIAAAQNGNVELVELLLASGADVNAVALSGTALSAATKAGNSELAGLLKKAGARR